MSILENIMEDNGFTIPSINESFCLDGLRNLLAKKTREFKDFAIESNSSLLNAENGNNYNSVAAAAENKYIKEFIIENQNENSSSDEEDKDNLENGFLDKDLNYNQYSNKEDDENDDYDKWKESDYNGLQHKINENINKEVLDKDKIVEDENEKIDENIQKDIKSNKNEKSENTEKRHNKTENSILNITTGNLKYLELIEMFTNLDKKKAHIETDLDYAIERIKEFKIDETRKNNLINDIKRMKENSTQKIENLGDELNEAINKTIIQNNNSILIRAKSQQNNLNDKNNNLNINTNKLNSIEILSELKLENESETEILSNVNTDKLFKIHDNNIIINKEFFSGLNTHSEPRKKNIEKEIKLNLANKEDTKKIDKSKRKKSIITKSNQDSINNSKSSSKILEQSNEINLEIINTSNNNIIENSINYSRESFNKNYKKNNNNNNNSIEIGMSINIQGNSNININNSNSEIPNKIYDINNIHNYDYSRISIFNKNFNLKKYRNIVSQSRNNSSSEPINLNLDYLKTINLADKNRIQPENPIKENNFNVQQETKIKLSNETHSDFFDEYEEENQLPNKKNNKVCFIEKKAIKQEIINLNTNKNSSITSLNIESKSETTKFDVKNPLNLCYKLDEIPKLQTSLLSKYSYLNRNRENIFFNCINTKNISSASNSLNCSNINNNVPQKEKNINITSVQKLENISNDKELSISKIRLNTPFINEDDFLTSTNPQTTNNLNNEFASSIDDDKNKVLEDLFFKLKEYSNKVPELNCIIKTYKDKLNVKNNDNCHNNLANILNNQFGEYYNLSNNNTNDNNFFKDSNNLNNINLSDKSYSIEKKLKSINIDSLNLISNFNLDEKSMMLDDDMNLERDPTHRNSNASRNSNISKGSKKTEEIISNLEIKAEKVSKIFLKKNKVFKCFLILKF